MANDPGDASTTRAAMAAWVLPGSLLLLFLVGSGCGAFFSLFSQFRFYDDEGYLLVSLRQFLQGHRLYDEIFSQYGPFSYLIHGLLFKAGRVDVGHDAMRLLVLAQCVGIALLAAGAAFRLTGNRWLSVLVFPVVLQAGHAMFNEPGHPQTLALLLLFGLALAACRKDAATSVRSAALMGAGVGVLLMTKINVGIFALLALAWTLAVFSGPGWRRGAVLVVGLAVLALPWVLMAPQLRAPGYREFALTLSLSFLTVALLCVKGESTGPRVGRRLWLAAAAGCLAAVALIGAATLLTGTSVAGLLRGVAWRPGRNMWVLLSPFDVHSVAWGGVSLACGLLVRGRALTPGSFPFGVVLALKIGLALVTATLHWPELFPRALAFVWVGLLPGWGADKESRPSFGRVLLVSLAIIHALLLYPVAGTQKAIAMVPFVLIGAVCVHDAWRMATALRACELSAARSAAAGSVLVAALLIHQGWAAAGAFRLFRDGAPLDLPGARLMRLPKPDAGRLRDVVRELEPYETFVTVPGMNTLHLLARKDPPTTLNCTAWMILLSDAEQERVVAALAAAPKACVVYERSVLGIWTRGRAFDESPLMRFVKKEFRPVKAVGGYEIHERNVP